ncbi:MAG TPA: MobF family relaxase [Acidimicrobiales bacterium]|nr:MobF family relaxase [Acidimicrobiales bacterium]
MLTLTALTDPEYLISSVALGLDEYYAGIGEAPGVWTGRFSAALGLAGVVEPDQLRALVAGHHPHSDVDLLAGRRARKVNAFDATLSAPKGVSLLWALASPEVADIVVRCHTDAVATALEFLEDKAAVARQQLGGVRRRVGTDGFAVATFAHRTSREGDPQLHTHCLIANVVRRPDGSHVAFDANPLHDWAKATGSIYQAELQRRLSAELGIAWGPDRHGCREPEGFERHQLRAFSKRTLAIEAELEAQGATYESPAERMRADDAASLATRPAKDHRLTPTLLAQRWEAEAAEVGLGGALEIEAAVLSRSTGRADRLSAGYVTAALVDPDVGLCATRARFREAHVVEHIAALSAGRLTTAEICTLAEDFLASKHVVRLVPGAGERRRAPEWSTVAHRALEDRVLAQLGELASRPAPAVEQELVEQAVVAEGILGYDQAAAMLALCGEGGALRSLVAPAGFGKTTAVHAAAVACAAAGRPVRGVATTNQAVAGLRSVGLEATTIARLRLDLGLRPLDPGTVVVLDEVSQVSTRDAAVVLDAVVSTQGAQLWCLGDPRQAPAVGAPGLGAEVARMGEEGRIVAPVLTVNRRQRHEADRQALAELRAGRAAASQALRAEWGWEHEEATPGATREAMADAVAADIAVHGAEAVAALAVSHADCEDLADRIRRRLAADGVITGPALAGPSWGSGPDRAYGAGDRVLLHTKSGHPGLHNGSTGTVEAASADGLVVAFDDGQRVLLLREFVTGRRGDGNPNVSHAWARTVEGAEGGTWEAVHLLGTASLDNLVGYAGQSRSRVPTHTWNTRALVVADHGGVPADRRSATEVVLAGLEREPDTTFAANDDPFVLDRRLRAERAEHLRVLAAAPPDRSEELRMAEGMVRRMEAQARLAGKAAVEALERLSLLNRQGPLQALRRRGRDERAAAQAALERARDNGASFVRLRRRHQERVAELRAGQDRRCAYLDEHRWRRGRIAAIGAELERHWADAVLVAAGQDDPLAFGLDRLRAARAHFAGRVAAAAGPAPDSSAPAGPRRRDADALAELDGALVDSLAARVRALAGDPPAHLVEVLGRPPAPGAGRSAWCGLALRVEHYRDGHPEALGHDDDDGVNAAIGPRPSSRTQRPSAWDRVAGALRNAEAVVSVSAGLGDDAHRGGDGPAGWMATADRAAELIDAVEAAPLPQRQIYPERDLGADHGMSIGW